MICSSRVSGAQFCDDIYGIARDRRQQPVAQCEPLIFGGGRRELVVTVIGLDETTLQPIHARTSYLADEICWDRRFAECFTQTEDGRLAIDYRRFHDTEPIRSPPA